MKLAKSSFKAPYCVQKKLNQRAQVYVSETIFLHKLSINAFWNKFNYTETVVTQMP